MKKTFKCSCGEKIILVGTPQAIEKARDLWAKSHQGPGHQIK